MSRGLKRLQREGTQGRRLSSYTGDQKKEIKADLSQHFEANEIGESHTTSGTMVNAQGKCLSLSPQYSWKIEEF